MELDIRQSQNRRTNSINRTEHTEKKLKPKFTNPRISALDLAFHPGHRNTYVKRVHVHFYGFGIFSSRDGTPGWMLLKPGTMDGEGGTRNEGGMGLRLGWGSASSNIPPGCNKTNQGI